MNSKGVLKLPMQENDADAETIGEYLAALLGSLIREGEGFSSKRPFGNSGWYSDLKFALVKGGAVNGSITTLEYKGVTEETLDSVNTNECDLVLHNAMRFALTK